MEIEKGLFRHDDISWPSIAEIHVETKKVEFTLDNEKSVEINFGGMSYSVNQTVKPEIFAAATAFAEAKGIEVKGQQGARVIPHFGRFANRPFISMDSLSIDVARPLA